MPSWLDKAKEAASKATEEAKKLAGAAKNANYGAMLDKTKNMAMHAAEKAKEAAGSVMKKEGAQPATKPDVVPEQDNPQTSAQPSAQTQAAQVEQPQATQSQTMQTPVQPQINTAAITSKIAQVEQLLQEIKNLLK